MPEPFPRGGPWSAPSPSARRCAAEVARERRRRRRAAGPSMSPPWRRGRTLRLADRRHDIQSSRESAGRRTVDRRSRSACVSAEALSFFRLLSPLPGVRRAPCHIAPMTAKLGNTAGRHRGREPSYRLTAKCHTGQPDFGGSAGRIGIGPNGHSKATSPTSVIAGQGISVDAKSFTSFDILRKQHEQE